MSWQVQEAKRKFSALIQRALDEGPQIVTRRGEEIVVIISANEFRRLTGDKPDFREFLLAAPDLDELDLRHADDRARVVEL